MACQQCGDVCVCSILPDQSPFERTASSAQTDSAKSKPEIQFVDPEALDASEQHFEASLTAPPAPRFIVDLPTVKPSELVAPIAEEPAAEQRIAEIVPVDPSSEIAAQDFHHEDAQSEGLVSPDSPEDDWRQQVAARVQNYRSRRRTRGPKYPSLHLPFERLPDPPEAQAAYSAAPIMHSNLAFDDSVNGVVEPEIAETGKLIAFPRSSMAPPPRLEELADPVLERPRIVEAPALVAPQPALGGILLEPPNEESRLRPGVEIPLQTASRERRLLAAFVDLLFVLLAGASFAGIFYRMNHRIPPPAHLLGAAIVLPAVLWFTYQHLLLTWTGSTPGLRLARLQVCDFDGAPVLRRKRQWRVLASVLSLATLGLGYLWCFLDDDSLCWHDRITGTHLMPRQHRE